MEYVELIALLAMLQFVAFGALTAKARGQSGLKAPAMTGHDGFERMYRVQMNTLELLVVFLPALFLAAKYWPAALVSGLGIVYLIGRHLYWRAYTTAPSKRGFGFTLSLVPTVLLLLAAFVGVALALLGLKS
ncbi:MAG: MAPEG family protein [Albidovulum sp.]